AVEHALHLAADDHVHALVHVRLPRSSAKPASSTTFTPSSCALASLEPGASPATTSVVFRETLLVTLPPRRSISALASSRDIDVSSPVSTTIWPSMSPPRGSASAWGVTP